MSPPIPKLPPNLVIPVRTLVFAASNLSRVLAIVLEETVLRGDAFPESVEANAQLIKTGESVIDAWRRHLAIDGVDSRQ